MSPVQLIGLLAGAAVLAACTTPEPAPVVVQPVVVPAPAPAPVAVVAPPAPRYSALTMHAGTYQCELNRRVLVRQVSADQSEAVVGWNSRDYTLRMVQTSTGALRYEDKVSGLTWISVLGKSMLLDTKHGKQLANECKV